MRRWSWRCLAGEDNTRGPGRVELGGWRALEVGGRVLGPSDVALVLVDDTPPEPFVVDLGTGRPLDDDTLDQVVEWRASGFFPVGAEADPDFVAPLEDGQSFVSAGRLLRFHAGHAPTTTARSAVSLQSGRCEITVTLRPAPMLQVVDGTASVDVAAEFVRVVAPYLEARRDDVPRGGWLSLDDAYGRWLELGGSANSDRDRVAQDRSRLCRSLAKQGL
ncbi:MAG: hypothetical protein AAFP22_23915, partial [Planctomycetota bacterium]